MRFIIISTRIVTTQVGLLTTLLILLHILGMYIVSKHTKADFDNNHTGFYISFSGKSLTA